MNQAEFSIIENKTIEIDNFLLEVSLMRAAQIIRTGWTKDALARDSQGRRVSVVSQEAVSFSLEGAIRRAIGEQPQEFHQFLLTLAMQVIETKLRANWAAAAEVPENLLRHWNDNATSAEQVIEMLEQIALGL